MDETTRLAMRRKHSKRAHTCQFCKNVFYGNGGYSAHMRKEYFERMPDMKSVKWITVVELRHEWRRRNPETLASPADHPATPDD